MTLTSLNLAPSLTLSHYLASMACEVPEIKMSMVRRWFLVIDPKCYTCLETLLTGENN